MTRLRVLILLCFLGGSAFSQNNNDEALKKIKELRDGMSSLRGQPTSEMRTLVRQSRGKLNDAVTLLSGAHHVEVSQEYIAVLDSLLIFQRKISDSPNPELSLTRFGNDINLKFKRPENAMTADWIVTMAEVQIHALKEGQDIHGLRVHYAALAFEIDLTKDYFTFEKLTSPASKTIIPGVYQFWLTRAGEVVSEPLWTEVKPNGPNSIDLTVLK